MVLLGGFIYAVSEFLDVLEDDMIHGGLARDVAHVSALYHRDPSLLNVPEPGLRVFVVERGETAELPASLAHLKAGHFREVRLPDAQYEYGATRRDIGDTSLYILRDLSPEERLEKELIALAWIVGLGSLFLAVLLALWLSHLVVRPVREFAARVAEIVPGQARPALRSGTGDRQLDVIVEAFVGVLDRFDTFVAREQAFTEDASHELRTPLATITSSIDLIAKDPALGVKTRTRLVRAQQAAARMQELIDSLLLLARAEAGHGYRTAVGPVVREAIAMQRQAGSGDDQALSTPDIRFEMAEERYVPVPASMLLSLVNNLLRNAVEHARSARIDIRLDRERLCITDHGSGMAPAVMSRVFDRRFRGESSRGHGLGLYLVKRICEHLGWTVDVQSTPGVGTSFDLTFADALPSSVVVGHR
ncbi:integral membrane sensor signal transduction histidine kinase [Salinisphaera sp. T31B1]